MGNVKKKANVVGAKVRKLRSALGLTQDLLAARCGVRGWMLSRGTLAKIEAGVRCVTDAELWLLARALGCALDDLYPEKHAEILNHLDDG